MHEIGKMSDHELTLWGLYFGVFGTVLALIGLAVALIAIDRFRKAVWQRCKVTFPYFPLAISSGVFVVLVVAAMAMVHLHADVFPMLLLSYFCLFCAAALGYLLFAAPFLPRLNILAWQGWELLDGHVGALSGWPLTRFRMLYYFRGISSTTELYDKKRVPLHIVILDVERLAAINEQAEDNLGQLITEKPRNYPELLSRLLQANEDRLPPGRLRYGTPVRFGFNELLYSRGVDRLFQPDAGLPSLKQLELAYMHRWAENKEKQLRLLFWDWSLPTLSTMLCAYKARRLSDEAKSKGLPEPAAYPLSEVYRLDGQEVLDLCKEIRRDLQLFDGRAFRVGRVEQLQAMRKKRVVEGQDVHDVIVGFGSMALGKRDRDLLGLIPREGMLTWVEFASLIKGPDQVRAEQAIGRVILSLATQVRLLSCHAPRGLPATKEAFERCAARRSAPLIMKTAEELNRHPSVPLVMRRLPGNPTSATTPQSAAIREVWEEGWALIRKELKPTGET